MSLAESPPESISQEQREDVVYLSAEDRMRMDRLYEEVSGRLQEMALIVARNLGMNTKEGIQATFTPIKSSATASLMYQPVSVVCSPSGCGCYDYNVGVCQPC